MYKDKLVNFPKKIGKGWSHICCMGSAMPPWVQVMKKLNCVMLRWTLE